MGVFDAGGTKGNQASERDNLGKSVSFVLETQALARVAGLDRLRLKQRNPQRKITRTCFRQLARSHGADHLTLRVQ